VNVEIIVFSIVSAAAVASALGVLFSNAVIRSAVWLLFTLVAVALLYFLLGFAFLGAAQLIVYVGGTLVLLVFGAMLTTGGPFAELRVPGLQRIVAGVLIVALFAGLAIVSLALGSPPDPGLPEGGAGPLGLAFLGMPDPQGKGAIGYLLPFEIVSVHLLAVLVGAAYLARTRKERAK
jgi:NADH-quinone oxidoreductase subunit J